MVQLAVPEGDAAVCKPCLKQGKGITKVILDHSMGDLICTSCGLVLQSRLLDEGQEWRNFASDSVDYGMKVNERMRGGDRDGELDAFGALASTSFSGNGMDALKKAQDAVDSKCNAKMLTSSERSLKTTTTKFRTIAKELRLSDNVVEKSLSFMNTLSENNQLGQSHQAGWYFAIAYLACREENMGRTMRELAHTGASERSVSEDDLEKQMAKFVSRLRKALHCELKQSKETLINPEDLTLRFAGKLQLSVQVSNAAVHIAVQARKVLGTKATTEKQQCAVIMSAIVLVAHLLDVPEKPRLEDLSAVAKVPQMDIVEVYEKLKPHLTLLLPDAVLSRSLENLGNIPNTIRPPASRQPVVPGRLGASAVATK